MCVCTCVHMCHSKCVEVKGQLTAFSSLLPPHGSEESNSGPRAGLQVPLPAEPSASPPFEFEYANSELLVSMLMLP